MLPASMSVAPNSPSARAKARTSPAMIPLRASGNVTSSAVRHSERPSVNAAFSSSRSTDSMAARAVRTRSGSAMTVAERDHDAGQILATGRDELGALAREADEDGRHADQETERARGSDVGAEHEHQGRDDELAAGNAEQAADRPDDDAGDDTEGHAAKISERQARRRPRHDHLDHQEHADENEQSTDDAPQIGLRDTGEPPRPRVRDDHSAESHRDRDHADVFERGPSRRDDHPSRGGCGDRDEARRQVQGHGPAEPVPEQLDEYREPELRATQPDQSTERADRGARDERRRRAPANQRARAGGG